MTVLLAAWMQKADCSSSTVDPELFFPIGDGEANQADIETAKGVCRRCPARQECLDYAVNTAQSGIWGGTTEGERRHLRRERLANAAPDPDAPQKRCTSCGHLKVYAAFSIRSRNSDRHDTQCKDCRNATHAAKQLTGANA